MPWIISTEMAHGKMICISLSNLSDFRYFPDLIIFIDCLSFLNELEFYVIILAICCVFDKIFLIKDWNKLDNQYVNTLVMVQYIYL